MWSVSPLADFIIGLVMGLGALVAQGTSLDPSGKYLISTRDHAVEIITAEQDS